MTQNKRIALNIVATYGRSLYALVLGLFCGRWALMALGEVDYGLMGVVGGLTAFISFFNGVLSTSIGRFYAYSIGSASRSGNEKQGLAECRKWFTVAVSVHTIVPVVLMAIGYPVGVWAVEHWLTIPPDRVADCVWVFRFVCISCFVGMINVPFSAMYTAKQEIAELTIYGFVTATLNVCFLYYLISHPGVWLFEYALWSAVLAGFPALVIMCRALVVFKECRIVPQHLWAWDDMRELASFAGWNLFGSVGNLLKASGMAVLVNKMFGPVQNAAMAISNTVSAQSQTLAGSLIGAFMPAITNACGSGDRRRMVLLMGQTCRLGTLLTMVFAIPLSLEIDEVMILWLKNPPAQSPMLCVWLMAVFVLDGMTTGHYIAVSANGKIALYQFAVGTCIMLSVPLAWVLIRWGYGLASVGIALLAVFSAVMVLRVIFVRLLLDVSIRDWISHVFMPIVVTCVVVCGIGGLPRIWMPRCFLRVCVTALLCSTVLFPLAWFWVLTRDEREFLTGRFRGVICKVTKKKE